MQSFVDRHVEDSEWYAFLGDTNKPLDDTFMYEAPLYEAEGHRVTNPVLVPRPGESRSTYVMDWVRTLDGTLVFRLFTGLIGSPHAGFHGETAGE